MLDSIGFGELAVICIVLIIAVGPQRLPSMMKTVGKTMRTLRQASRDLRESTGIDELLREDFDYHPPPRRAPEPQTVTRDIPLVSDGSMAGLPSDGPVPDAAADGVAAADSSAHGSHDASVAAASQELGVEPAPAQIEHADVTGTLPSDAPLAANEPVVDPALKPRES